ncbi:radical SAM protein [bacterium]|nr:radical SAM protein [bacterium]
MAKYVYGPVPSRRLGRSLGIDLFNGKSCTIDCVYCQLGSHPPLAPFRRRFIDPEAVIAELAEKVNKGVEADYITFSGSGEPTLSSDLGMIIEFAKGLKTAPVCVLTNGTLLWNPEVRKELANADVVIPNLDSADTETFRKVNRPHPDLDFDKIIDGLLQFSREYKGKLLFEIVLIAGLNDSDEHLAKLADLVKIISPDGVWVGTIYRPPAESFAKPIDAERLKKARDIIGGSARVIESFKAKDIDSHYANVIEEVRGLIKRRPETVSGIAKSLGINEHEVFKAVSILEKAREVERKKVDDRVFFEFIR